MRETGASGPGYPVLTEPVRNGVCGERLSQARVFSVLKNKVVFGSRSLLWCRQSSELHKDVSEGAGAKVPFCAGGLG